MEKEIHEETPRTKRATIYLDSELHRALKIQAAETSSNISQLVNHAVRLALLEDREDLAVFEERANENTMSFESLVKKLDLDAEIQY